MTPKEKAKDLIWKFNDNVQYDLKEVSFNGITSEVVGYNLSFETKRFALIAVDELIYFGNNELLSEMFEGDYYCDVDFFTEVKQEIEKL